MKPNIIKHKLFEPKFGGDELAAINIVLKSGYLTQGPKVAELEGAFASYIGAPYAVAVNSCTSALFLCLLLEKKKHGQLLVECPSVTFVSVANMILNSGHLLKFVDNNSVGVMYGLNNTKIIDSAHQCEMDMYLKETRMCFSFYPIKMLGGAEGGMIALDNKADWEWLKQMRSNGMERKGMFDWDYTVNEQGWKMNMTDLQAAILLTRLEKLADFNAKRKEIRDIYNGEFELANNSLHLYPIFVMNRNKFIKQMGKVGIGCSVHFKPIHTQPAYQFYNYDLPYSEWWGQHEVSIPLHENLSLDDAEYIIDAVKKHADFVTYNR